MYKRQGIARMEGIRAEEAPASPAPVRLVKIVENGITYEVDFAQGHKTGFFCDPVSYTHLYVYKRQEPGSACFSAGSISGIGG